MNQHDTAKYFKKGIEYYESGKFQDAIECFDNVIRQDKNNVEANAWKGKCLYESGKFQDAIECFDNVIRQDKNNVEAYNKKIESLNYLGNYEEAYKCAEQAIDKIGANYASLLSLKAESLSYLGRANEAIKFADKALELLNQPNMDCERSYALFIKGYSLQYEGNYDEALTHINSAINICKDKAVEALITKGIILNQSKPSEDKHIDNQLNRFEEAIKCFEEAIKIASKEKYRDQDIAYAFINKSVSYLLLKRNQKALDCCKEAIIYSSKCILNNPKDAHAWMIKGVALFQLEFYDLAIECYDKIIMEINCKFDFAWYLKGYALNYLERYDEALKYFEQAIAINKEDTDYDIGKGISLYYLGRYNDAINSFSEEGLDKDSAYKDIVLFSRGASYYAKGEYHKALDDFQNINDVNLNGEKRNGFSAQKYTNIGACYHKIGLYEKARENYNKAIDNDDKAVESNLKLVDAYYNLGILNYNEGNVDTAKKILESCLNTDNKFAQSKAREALEKLKSNLTDTSEWFKWWFTRGIGKKVFGITLILSILFFIGIIIAMTTITLYFYYQNMAVDNQNMALANQNMALANQNMALANQNMALANQTSTSEMLALYKDVIFLVITSITIPIGLLILILLFPSIRRVKVGDIIELEKLEPVTSGTDIPKQMEPLFIKIGFGMQSF